MNRITKVLLWLVPVLGVSVSINMHLSNNVSALSGSDFNAGNIISDSLFYNGDTMTVTEIQNFLNSKVPTCDTNGSQSTSYYFTSSTGEVNNANDTWDGDQWVTTTRAVYGARVAAYFGEYKGSRAPYTCLKDYRQNTGYKAGESGLCSAIEAKTNQTAAQIIDSVANACHISEKVLLVMLQKEQGFITDDWPWIVQYEKAMGFYCPDDASRPGWCHPDYAGFFNQVYNAALQFQRYKADPYNWNHVPFMTNQVKYQANAPSCGARSVYIENYATAGLYNYTPYTPNQAALNNLYGTGDGCSAYGNRNFWRYYSEWFGSTQHEFQMLETPRWMQVRTDGVQKVNVITGEKVGEIFTAGRQMRFMDKIYIGGKWYLRTEFNHNDHGPYGIAQENLEEIPFISIAPKWVTFSQDGYRSYPASRTAVVGDRISHGASVKVVDQITIDGNLYYRTEYNRTHNQSIGIHNQFVTDFSPISLITPRDFCSNVAINQTDPRTGVKLGSVEPGTYHISKKTLVNGVWYFQAASDENTAKFFNSGDLRDACYVPLEGPREMRLTQTVTRFNPYTNEKLDTLSKGSVISFSTKLFINSQWYFRTTHNTVNNIDAVIPASAVSD